MEWVRKKINCGKSKFGSDGVEKEVNNNGSLRTKGDRIERLEMTHTMSHTMSEELNELELELDE